MMDRRFLVADSRNPKQMARFGAALSAWEPRLSLFCWQKTQRLFVPNRTLYALLMDGQTTLRRGDVERKMSAGDMAVIARNVTVQVDAPSDFIVFAYNGASPDHFDDEFVQRDGFEVHVFDPSGKYASTCGFRKEVIFAHDLRYRVRYHFVEINQPKPHTHEDMVEFYYVLYGEGHIAIGETMDNLERVPVHTGCVVAVGPHLYHPPSDGLGTSIVFLYDETTHERMKASQVVATAMHDVVERA
jgi:mannose-6-phosphate isomerase-like protein (cupin superfamily)